MLAESNRYSEPEQAEEEFWKELKRGKMALTLSIGLQGGPLQMTSSFGHKQTSKDTHYDIVIIHCVQFLLLFLVV